MPWHQLIEGGASFDGMDIVISELRSDKELLRKRH